MSHNRSHWYCLRWWFDIDRREANHQLLLSGNNDGTFLVRNGKGMLNLFKPQK